MPDSRQKKKRKEEKNIQDGWDLSELMKTNNFEYRIRREFQAETPPLVNIPLSFLPE